MSEMRRLDASIRGRVQGVGFRYFVQERAFALGLRGWVANQRDGSVRCIAEGPQPDLERLLEALRAGPAGGRVDAVDAAWTPASGEFGGFGVRAAWHSGD